MQLHRGLVVAVLVVLAGCGASLGAGPPGTRTETLTPVPVEPDSETRTQPAMRSAPPGISVDGSVDVKRLLNAHSEALDGRSYMWTMALTYDTNKSGETQLLREFQRRVRVEGERVLAEEWRSDGSKHQTLYVEGSTGYIRVDTDDGSAFESLADPGDAEAYAVGTKLAWRYLAGVNLTVDAVTQGGQTYYRLSGVDDIPTPLTLRGGLTSRIDEYRATAYVTPAGLVKTLIVEYLRSNDGRYHHVSVRFDYEALDRTTVTRPDWVDQLTPTPNQNLTLRSKLP